MNEIGQQFHKALLLTTVQPGTEDQGKKKEIIESTDCFHLRNK